MLVLLSAGLYPFCFAPTGHVFLAWGVLVPLLVGLRLTDRVTAAVLGGLWAIVAAYGLNDWFARGLSHYYQQTALVGVGFFVGVSVLTASPFYAVFAAWYADRDDAVPHGPSPLAVGAALAASELLRTRLGGDPWALLGHTQGGGAVAAQVADLTGVYGVTLVIGSVNAVLADGCLAAVGRSSWQRVRRDAGLTLAVVAAALLYGAVQLHVVDGTPTGAVPVTIVQPNVDVGSQWSELFYGQNLDRLLRLTDDAQGARPAPIVVWPESAMTFFLEEEPIYRRTIGRVLARSQSQLISGGVRAIDVDTGAPRYFNSAFLVATNGDVLARYDKEHLLPFAEYFPLASVDFMQRRFGRVRSFSPGGPPALLPTVAGPAGVIVCNEGLFPDSAASRAAVGATWLVNLANDSWIPEVKFGEEVLQMVTFRAIEQRRWLVRASTSGPSAVVDPAGRIVTRTPALYGGVLQGAFGTTTARTVYGQIGDAFGWGCLAVVVWAWWRRRG